MIGQMALAYFVRVLVSRVLCFSVPCFWVPCFWVPCFWDPCCWVPCLLGSMSLGFRVSGFRVSGFRVSGLRVSGLLVSGIRVSGFRVSGLPVSGFRVSGFRVSGFDRSIKPGLAERTTVQAQTISFWFALFMFGDDTHRTFVNIGCHLASIMTLGARLTSSIFASPAAWSIYRLGEPYSTFAICHSNLSGERYKFHMVWVLAVLKWWK